MPCSHSVVLSICIVICAGLYSGGIGLAMFPSRGSVWTLGVLLIFCGVSQLTQCSGHGAGLSLGGDVVAGVGRMLGRGADLAAFAGAGAPSHSDIEGYEREIAERQRAEAALSNSEAAARKLAEADARKNEFLAMLGHELRNPLAPIRNAVKVMKQRGSDDPDLCWARDVVDHQVRQMAQLVDDLLEISRVTSGKVRLQKEAVDVATIVAYAVETSRPGPRGSPSSLSIALPAEPVYVDADSIRMAQVLSNLLNNAAKYTAARRTDPPGCRGRRGRSRLPGPG